uniref:Uncharacterized protein n=1 Tax=Lutzomyia longipalpis TaxID=7200 RepID=A0A1B0CV84_LUTLO
MKKKHSSDENLIKVFLFRFCAEYEYKKKMLSQEKVHQITTLGQGIRSGGQIIPITGSGGLHHHGTIDRKTSGSLRSSLSKVFGFTKTRPEKLFNPTSPTNSYSSEDYATVGSFFSPPPTQHPPQPPTTTPPPSLPSHRVSAPPTESVPIGCTLPRNGSASSGEEHQ